MMFFIVPSIFTIGCIVAAVAINSVAFAWLAVFFTVLTVAFLLLELEAKRAEDAGIKHSIKLMNEWNAKQGTHHG